MGLDRRQPHGRDRAAAGAPAEREPAHGREAAALLIEAWADPDFGTLVMFAMTTGARRGEICALRWSQLDLDTGVAVFRASIGQIAGKRWEKDTKTHGA